MVTKSLSKPHTSYKKQLTNKKSYEEVRKQKQELIAKQVKFREERRKQQQHGNPNKVPLGSKEDEDDEDDLDYDDSINSLSFVLKKLKSDIKGTKRALKQPDLTAADTLDLQRQLKALQLQRTLKLQIEKEYKLHLKYKYIKFVERQKLTRKLTKLQKLLTTTSEDDKADLQSQIDQVNLDLHYVLFYPRDMKYVALFPSESGASAEVDPKAVEVNKTKMETIKAFIKEKLDAGELVKGYIVRRVNVFGGEDEKNEGSDVEAEIEKKPTTKAITKTETVETTAIANSLLKSKFQKRQAAAVTAEEVQRSKTKFVHSSDDEEEDAELPTVLEGDDFFMTVPSAASSGNKKRKSVQEEAENSDVDKSFVTVDEEISVRTPKKPRKQKQK